MPTSNGAPGWVTMGNHVGVMGWWVGKLGIAWCSCERALQAVVCWSSPLVWSQGSGRSRHRAWCCYWRAKVWRRRRRSRVNGGRNGLLMIQI